ncbi:NAD(P)-dependent oxidoreductase [Ancylobacter sp. MQZ15Z-1]|uniref:NAD(P)-dependent oxidoreductase n=1 Tax=Ancylobacter mangrovi TaxID=2972472 RepID=A0A9X2P9I3_9HYPH|nr:NAD(P)-dependent oxidoreductase [Ancylobacter mangrovi]MCS0494682.1 NAD(P)-dependent oxidoreductase [Ancylobacter mangrovi]
MAERIGFLGTGLMGRPMAERLLAAGLPLAAWNRTLEKARPLEALGATIAPTPAAAVEGAGIVCIILEHAASIEEVLFAPALIEALAPGTVVVDLTSLHPDAARENARRLAGHGVVYLDAPVSGGPPGAVEGTLAIMVGGEPRGFERAQPVLSRLGRAIHVGPSGSGQITKLGSQIISGAALAAVAEALLLFSQTGVAVERAREALFGGYADSKVLRLHGERMIGRHFEPGGHVRTFLKDLNAAADLAARAELDLPVATLSRAMFDALSRDGHGECDIAAMALEIERRNAGRRIGALPAGEAATGETSR